VVAMSMQPPPTHLSCGMLMINDRPVEVARELIAEEAVRAEAKYLWFVDDDTIPPPNALRRLHYVLENNPSVMAAGGVYMTKCDPPGPVVFRGLGLGPFWDWRVGEVFEVSGMGMGCTMIKCEIFKKIPPPWFPWIDVKSCDPAISSIIVSEDISFCNSVRAAGYKVVAHGGILCDHWDISAPGGIQTQVFQLPKDSLPYRPREEGQQIAGEINPGGDIPPGTPLENKEKLNGSISTS
jgi:hypothetical protein